MNRWNWLAIVTGVVMVAGCSPHAAGPTAEQVALGQKFLLADEPGGAVGIIDYRESPPAEDQADVTLLGRIGGGKLTWSNQSATFLLCDPAHEIGASSEHECHSDNCPFCKGKTNDDHAQAIVMLTGADGKVPPVDVRKLLPLAEGQTVVVSGRAEVNAIGQLVVHARGLYVRR